MNTPYGLEIIENCVTCKLRRDKWFCGLSPEVLKSFSSAGHLSTYPGGAILFVEGQAPRGIVVLCSGKVKLSTTSRDGKVLILRMSEPGDALGLSAVISGTPYELTFGNCGTMPGEFRRSGIPDEASGEVWRTGFAFCAGAQPGISIGLSGHS